MLELVRLFASRAGVRHMYAVADDHKISRHPYFSKKETGGLCYDDVWLERGGTRVAPTHFELPLAGTRRDLNEVAPKKRSMYRRRYQMFDIWRSRVRKIEENFYGPILRRNPVSPHREWGERVARDLFLPRYKTSFLVALRARLVRNYWGMISPSFRHLYLVGWGQPRSFHQAAMPQPG